MRKDNRGLTLVELVIAVAMSTIVIGAASMFLYNAQKSYRIAEQTIDLQMEAQVLMEQLGSWVMESNMVKIVGDSLVLYNVPRLNGENTTNIYPTGYTRPVNATRRIIWVENQKIYMVFDDTISDAASDAASLVGDIHDGLATDDNCIAEYVASLTATIASEENSIYVELLMQESKQSYALSNDFTFRNAKYETSSIDVFNLLRKVVNCYA